MLSQPRVIRELISTVTVLPATQQADASSHYTQGPEVGFHLPIRNHEVPKVLVASCTE